LSRRLAAAIFFQHAGTGPALAAPIAVTAEPVALDPLDPGRHRIGALDSLAGFVLRARSPDWGGWSGLAITPDGRRLTAISDIGSWLVLDLRQDAAGRLTGIGSAAMLPVLDRKGRAIETKHWADAEALARDRDGSWLVAFEQQHRIWRYPRSIDDRAVPVPVNAPPAIGQLPSNKGIEAMTVLDDGSILLVSEKGLPGEPDIAAWLGRPGAWSRLTLARTGLYTVSDAATLPGGDVLLVERYFTLLGAGHVRLSLIARSAIRPGARLVGHPLAELGPPLSLDNFEGAATRLAPDGATLIYLISDDNQSFLQRTLLFQFRLAPTTAGAAVAGSP
jgi:hypothetical protein